MLGNRRSVSLGILVLSVMSAEAWGGCSATQPTEIVPGAMTQVEVPKDLAGIKVQVLANGATKFNQSYLTSNGNATLPATLGVVSGGSPSTTLTVIIGGYDQNGVMQSNFQDGSQSIAELGTPGGPRVRRGSVQTYVDQQTLFLPMPLSYACWDYGCPDSTDTCKGGQCVSQTIDPTTLAPFDPSLVDGTQDCFNPDQCFPAAETVSAQPVDVANCVFTLPPGSKAGPGLNIRVYYQDQTLPRSGDGWGAPQLTPTGEQEILNVEPDSAILEGFSVPDTTAPTTFRLAPGLCNLYHQVNAPPTAPPAGFSGSSYLYHPIWDVQMSTACPSKPLLLPFCSADQHALAETASGGTTSLIACNQPLSLEPAPSAVYLVMDNSSAMSGAFGASGYATDTGAALTNPVFKSTHVAFEFLDHSMADCTAGSTPYETPGTIPNSLDFQLANAEEPALVPLLLSPTPPDPAGGPYANLDLLTALRLDHGAYRHLLDYESTLGEAVNVGAVMFFVNREPESVGDPDAGSGGVLTGADCPLSGGATSTQAAIETEVAQAAAMGIQTYFVVLSNSLGQGNPLAFYASVASDLAAKGISGVQAIDATEGSSMEAQVIGRIGTVAATFGTCLYELPPGLDTNASMVFTLPVPTPISSSAPVPIHVPFDSTCSASTQTTANGWNIDGAHVRVCGTATNSLACARVKNGVLAVAAAAALSSDAGADMLPTAADVSVTVTMPCASTGADASTGG